MKGMFCPQCIREGQVTEHGRRCFQYLSILYMLLTLLGAPGTSESAVLHQRVPCFIRERRASLPELFCKTLRHIKALLS